MIEEALSAIIQSELWLRVFPVYLSIFFATQLFKVSLRSVLGLLKIKTSTNDAICKTASRIFVVLIAYPMTLSWMLTDGVITSLVIPIPHAMISGGLAVVTYMFGMPYLKEFYPRFYKVLGGK